MMFDNTYIHKYSERPYYSFSADLRNIFDKETNYDVERELDNAGVIVKSKNVATDTEHSALYVYFSTVDHATKFIDNLNRYIEFLKSLRKHAPEMFKMLVLQ